MPRPISVELDNKQLPVRIVDDRGGKREVVRVLEVWRVDDEWWRSKIARRYIEAIMDNGSRITLFEDQISGQWFEQTVGR
ncbi:MAG: hypothetical protein ACE5FJ_10250 [Gemmatimonadales bacterium]